MDPMGEDFQNVVNLPKNTPTRIQQARFINQRGRIYWQPDLGRIQQPLSPPKTQTFGRYIYIWSNFIATSHDQKKTKKVAFLKGNGTPYFRGNLGW